MAGERGHQRLKIKGKYLRALIYFIVDFMAKQIIGATKGYNIIFLNCFLDQKPEDILDILFFYNTNPHHQQILLTLSNKEISGVVALAHYLHLSS